MEPVNLRINKQGSKERPCSMHWFRRCIDPIFSLNSEPAYRRMRRLCGINVFLIRNGSHVSKGCHGDGVSPD